MRRNNLFRWSLPGAAMIFLGLAVMSTSASAISRYTSTSMTCASVKAKVRNEGAVILRWASSRTGNTLFGRFVANRGYCSSGEVTEQRAIPASNTKKCLVLKCVRPSFSDDDDWPIFRRR